MRQEYNKIHDLKEGFKVNVEEIKIKNIKLGRKKEELEIQIQNLKDLLDDAPDPEGKRDPMKSMNPKMK